MPWVDVDQHSDEWLRMRVGVCTASRMHDIIARLKKKSANGEKGDYKASRYNYMVELACEHLTGRASEHYVSDWMIRGQEDEAAALAAYEAETGEMTTNGGFYLHDTIKYAGASPDAKVGDIGLLELKNLKPENHFEILRGGVIPEDYIWQMNMQLACAPEREWVDYGSYCKEMITPGLRLFVRRHHRDRERIAECEAEVGKFLDELAEMLHTLTAARPIVTELTEAK
jgi:hypothetical protein